MAKHCDRGFPGICVSENGGGGERKGEFSAPVLLMTSHAMMHTVLWRGGENIPLFSENPRMCLCGMGYTVSSYKYTYNYCSIEIG